MGEGEGSLKPRLFWPGLGSFWIGPGDIAGTAAHALAWHVFQLPLYLSGSGLQAGSRTVAGGGALWASYPAAPHTASIHAQAISFLSCFRRPAGRCDEGERDHRAHLCPQVPGGPAGAACFGGPVQCRCVLFLGAVQPTSQARTGVATNTWRACRRVLTGRRCNFELHLQSLWVFPWRMPRRHHAPVHPGCCVPPRLGRRPPPACVMRHIDPCLHCALQPPDFMPAT